MANTFLTPQIVAIEALRILQSNIVFRDLVYNNYSSEFASVGDTVNVRKRSALSSNLYNGSSVTVQNITEQSVPVKLDIIRDTSVSVTSKELTLDIVNFSEQVIAPALIGLAQDVDTDIANAIAGYAGSTVSKTSTPTNLADIANLAKALDKKKAPKDDRHLVFATDHKYDYALTDNLSKVAYAGDNAALRDAILGKIYGFNTYMSQNCPDTEAGTAGTATTYKVTGTKGASTVALSSVSATTGTVKDGDGFIYDGRLYRFTADATAVGGNVASVAIAPALHTAASAADVVLVNKPISVAFHREGVAFVTRPLDLPMGAARAYVAQAENIAVRVVFTYDKDAKKDIISFDVLYGIACLNKNLIAKLV